MPIKHYNDNPDAELKKTIKKDQDVSNRCNDADFAKEDMNKVCRKKQKQAKVRSLTCSDCGEVFKVSAKGTFRQLKDTLHKHKMAHHPNENQAKERQCPYCAYTVEEYLSQGWNRKWNTWVWNNFPSISKQKFIMTM